MADGHVSRSSYVIALFFLGILYNTGRLSFEDRFCFATAADLEFGTYYQPGGDIAENRGPSTKKLICPECSRTIEQRLRLQNSAGVIEKPGHPFGSEQGSAALIRVPRGLREEVVTIVERNADVDRKIQDFVVTNYLPTSSEED